MFKSVCSCILTLYMSKMKININLFVTMPWNDFFLACRFFFENWFGQGPRTSYRYSLTRDRINPVLDCCVIDYLFAQVKYKICDLLSITFIFSQRLDFYYFMLYFNWKIYDILKAFWVYWLWLTTLKKCVSNILMARWVKYGISKTSDF